MEHIMNPTEIFQLPHKTTMKLTKSETNKKTDVIGRVQIRDGPRTFICPSFAKTQKVHYSIQIHVLEMKDMLSLAKLHIANFVTLTHEIKVIKLVDSLKTSKLLDNIFDDTVHYLDN